MNGYPRIVNSLAISFNGTSRALFFFRKPRVTQSSWQASWSLLKNCDAVAP